MLAGAPIRFVAGRGAEAELLQAGNRRHRGLPAGALQKTVGSGYGNKLQQGKQSAGREHHREQAREEHPVLQANKKESGKAHSLKPTLMIAALVRVTGARPRGS